MGAKFECYKSFNETCTYVNAEGDEVIISNLWRYATLIFPESDIPIQDVNGNYYELDLPDEHEYHDLYVNNVDVYINNNDELKEKVESYDDENIEEFLEELGFESNDVVYDIIQNGEESVVISKI